MKSLEIITGKTDGGMWKLKARQTVKAFLEKQLAEEAASNGVYIAKRKALRWVCYTLRRETGITPIKNMPLF